MSQPFTVAEVLLEWEVDKLHWKILLKVSDNCLMVIMMLFQSKLFIWLAILKKQLVKLMLLLKKCLLVKRKQQNNNLFYRPQTLRLMITIIYLYTQVYSKIISLFNIYYLSDNKFTLL